MCQSLMLLRHGKPVCFLLIPFSTKEKNRGDPAVGLQTSLLASLALSPSLNQSRRSPIRLAKAHLFLLSFSSIWKDPIDPEDMMKKEDRVDLVVGLQVRLPFPALCVVRPCAPCISSSICILPVSAVMLSSHQFFE